VEGRYIASKPSRTGTVRWTGVLKIADDMRGIFDLRHLLLNWTLLAMAAHFQCLLQKAITKRQV
jgi:hypothetical protein